MKDKENLYNELKYLSEDINKRINSKLSEDDKPKKHDGTYVNINEHPVPIKFCNNIKYIFFNMNPSVGKTKKSLDQNFNGEYLFWIRKKLLKNNKDLENSLKEVLIFDFHKKQIELLEQIDPRARIFWEEKNVFENILNQFKIKDIKKDLEKIKDLLEDDLLEDNKNKFIIFCELVYYRYKKQKKIREIIEKDDELKEKIVKLFKLQFDYYDSNYVIITNAFVSKFFEKHLKDEKKISNNYMDERDLDKIPTIRNYKNSRVFCSTMFYSGNIDNYSIKRLQNEIKEKINKEQNV